MRFSDEAWQCTAGLREAIHRLPFNTELAAGNLSRNPGCRRQFGRAPWRRAAPARQAALGQNALHCLGNSLAIQRAG